MNDEAAFLSQIAATPEDIAPRLVYADWLQERDDPRGELIRVAEEMRTLAPYSDAYWALKPRRKTLRDGVPNEWLEAMRYNDVWPIFTHGWPVGWRERWRLIREYVERWHHIEMSDTSPYAKTQTMHVGRVLPPGIREWFDFVSNAKANDRFSLSRPPTFGFISQHIGSAALNIREADGLLDVVKLTDLDCDDPPVFRFHSSQIRTLAQSRTAAYAASMSLYALRFVLRQSTTHEFEYSQRSSLADLYAQLHQSYFSYLNVDGIRIFERPNVQIQLTDEPSGVHVRVCSAKPIERSEFPATIRQSLDRAIRRGYW